MKQIKIILTIVISMLAPCLFASNEGQEEFKQDNVTMCCVGEAHDGVEGTAGYIKITVKKCATSDTREKAYVSACGNATNAANSSLNALKRLNLTLSNQ